LVEKVVKKTEGSIGHSCGRKILFVKKKLPVLGVLKGSTFAPNRKK